MASRKFCNTVEAKTNLNKLLDEVSQGQEVVIRRRGKAIAKIVPAKEENLEEGPRIEKLIAQLRIFHQKVRASHGTKSHTVSLLRELRREAS